MVELALAFTDKDGSYAEHAAVVLTSVFHNTGSQINVNILHDETLTKENMLRITQLVMSHNHTVNFHSVILPDALAEVVKGAQSVNTWTQGSMYRLLLPSLVNANKVIYLDCDVMVNLDIQELWDIDLNSYYLAAVQDQGALVLADLLTSFGLNPYAYFNSGVILFELNNIRQHSNWYVRMLDFLRQYPGTTLPDQDVLNHNFGDNFYLLDERFNSFSIGNPELDFNQKIVHFAGEVKWWHPASPGYALYQGYLNLTPWRLPESHFAHLTHPVGHEPETALLPAVQEGAMPIVPPEHVKKHLTRHVRPMKARLKRSRHPKSLLRLKKLKKFKKLKFVRHIHRLTPIQRRRKVIRTTFKTVRNRTKRGQRRTIVHKARRISDRRSMMVRIHSGRSHTIPPIFINPRLKKKEGRPYFMTMK